MEHEIYVSREVKNLGHNNSAALIKKAVNMARMMNIPVLGIVENMSYVTCPDCGGRGCAMHRERHAYGRRGDTPRQ